MQKYLLTCWATVSVYPLHLVEYHHHRWAAVPLPSHNRPFYVADTKRFSFILHLFSDDLFEFYIFSRVSHTNSIDYGSKRFFFDRIWLVFVAFSRNDLLKVGKTTTPPAICYSIIAKYCRK